MLNDFVRRRKCSVFYNKTSSIIEETIVVAIFVGCKKTMEHFLLVTIKDNL